MGRPNSKFQRVDRPEIPEIYVDSLGLSSFDGGVIRYEFCTSRLDEPKPPAQPTGKKFVASRIAMNVDTFLELAKQVDQFRAILVQQGVIKMETPVTAPIVKN